jgi:hypothetical protein
MRNIINQIALLCEDEFDDLVGDEPVEQGDDQFGEPSPVDHLRDENGKLPPYAWPGGYNIVYITGDGGVLCAGPECANGPEARQADATSPDWYIEGFDTLESGAEPEICDHCGRTIGDMQT